MEIPDMEASRKSIPMQSFLEAVLGRSTAIANNRCLPFCCGRQIAAEEFATWTELERREYTISGMCNSCQDVFNGEPNPDDYVEVERPGGLELPPPPEAEYLDGDRPWMSGEPT
jgi:hypothetical protein